jgi:hypothetical protein
MNSRKPKKIDPFLPMLQPHSPDVPRRIQYQDGQFITAFEGDQEANNLIRFLGWNRPELAKDRSNHVKRVRDLRSFFDDQQSEFVDYLREHPENLSFATALEAELVLDLSENFE